MTNGNVTTVGLTLTSTFNGNFTFTLPTLDDSLVEGPESFTVAALNAAVSNGAFATASGIVTTTITETDTLVLSLTSPTGSSQTVGEGSAPSYTLAIANGIIPVGSTATVDLAITLPGGLTGAEASDFVETFLKDLQDAAGLGVTVGSAVTNGNVTTVGLTLTSTFNGNFTFTLPTLDDSLVEGPESFTVAALNAAVSNGAFATASGIVTTTITETDTLVLSLTSPTGSSQTVGEGSAPSYTLAIANGIIPVGSTATVDLAITLPGGLTGAEASDFVETFLKDLQDAAGLGVTVGSAVTNGNVTTVGLTLTSTFNGNFTFTLPTLDDSLVEGPESFTVAALNAAVSNGAFATASGIVTTTITETDTLVLSLTSPTGSSQTVGEGSAPSYTLAIANGIIPVGSTATVDLAITLPGGLTGAEASDFVETFLKDLQDAAGLGVTVGSAVTNGNVTTVGLTLTSTFNGNFTFTLPTLDDSLVEGPESFTVAALNAAVSNGAFATASGIVTTTITETDTLVLSLTSPTGSSQTVGEGSAPSYTLAIANGIIPVGSTATVDLAITLPGGLTGAEASDFVETFLKDLQDAAGLGVTVGSAVTNGNVTTVGLTLTSTFNGNFTFTLPTLDDSLVEGPESFTVAALNAAVSNGAFATASGIVTTTITETDTLVLSLTSPTGSSQTVGEGSAPSYTLAIANGIIPVGSTATVDLAITLPGGLTGAEASDFVETFLKDLQDAAGLGVTVGSAVTNGNVTTVGLTLTSTFNGNFTFTLPTLDDSLVEGPESFTVAALNAAASNGAFATASGIVTTTITETDTLVLSLTSPTGSSQTVGEGSAPSYTLAIANGIIPVGSTATVDLAITLPGGLTGAEASDFVETFLKDLQDAAGLGVTVGSAVTNGNVTTVGLTLTSTFNGDFTFTLPTLDNSLVEGPESFTVAALNAAASNGAFATASGIVTTTITDNDTLVLSLTSPTGSSQTVGEGSAPSYTLAIANGIIPVGSTATVDLAITLPGGLTGAEASDFVETFLKDLQDAAGLGVTVGSAVTNGNVTTVGLTLTSTFNGNFTFTLPTLDDSLVEGPESFTVAALNAAASNGAFATASGIVTTTITEMTRWFCL